MQFAKSSITHSTTGVKTWTLGFQPLEVELIVAPSPTGSVSDVRFSIGMTDGSTQVCDSVSVYSANRREERFTDRMASVWEFSGGTWSEVFKIAFDSITATEFKYNVVTANANYQVLRKARA